MWSCCGNLSVDTIWMKENGVNISRDDSLKFMEMECIWWVVFDSEHFFSYLQNSAPSYVQVDLANGTPPGTPSIKPRTKLNIPTSQFGFTSPPSPTPQPRKTLQQQDTGSAADLPPSLPPSLPPRRYQSHSPTRSVASSRGSFGSTSSLRDRGAGSICSLDREMPTLEIRQAASQIPPVVPPPRNSSSPVPSKHNTGAAFSQCMSQISWLS